MMDQFIVIRGMLYEYQTVGFEYLRVLIKVL
jgi:hypothetical protein